MPKTYRQLSLEDRCEIAQLCSQGQSIRQIAAALDRAPSSISREIKRNSGRQVGYKPAYADERTQARRWTGSMLTRKPDLRAAVLASLAQGWSPEQVAGRLERENNRHIISHETIYRFIYAELVRSRDYSWRLYLPRAKSRRGYRGSKGGSSASFFKDRVPIADRPDEVETRQSPGHWEADLMAFAKYGQSILTIHERQSRLILVARPQSKQADGIAKLIAAMLKTLPAAMRRTLTFDNGTEFARHHRLSELNVETFFCDPHAPWQKGGIENAIGRMRRHLPRKTDLALISDNCLNAFVRAYNATPRKCLDFQTPAEVFLQNLLHFKCESIPRLSTG